MLNNTPNDALVRSALTGGSTIELVLDVLRMPLQLRHTREQLGALTKYQDRLRESLEQVANTLAAGQRHDQSFAQQIDAVAAENARLARAVEALCQRQDVLEGASQQQRILSAEFFEQRVIDPLVHWCIPIVALIDQTKPSDAAQQPPDPTLQAVRAQILELLGAYGVESCPSSEGQAFDPKRMRPVATESTNQRDLDRTVARTLRVGWQRNQRLLQPECVTVYRYEPRAFLNQPTGGN
jgi:molecular chaperone GrpE (heat shock protein)